MFQRERVMVARKGWLIGMSLMLAVVLAACGGSDTGAVPIEAEQADDGHEREGTARDDQEEIDLEPQVEVGDSLADVPMTLLNGDTVSIGDYAGSVLLLFFWDTDWVSAAGPEKVAWYNAHLNDDGLVAFGVNSSGEPLGSIENYLDNFRTELPVVIDDDQALMALFGARTGTTVWIGPESDLKSIVETYRFTDLLEENVRYRLRIYLGES